MSPTRERRLRAHLTLVLPLSGLRFNRTSDDVAFANRALSERQRQIFISLFMRRIVACARKRHADLSLTPIIRTPQHDTEPI